MQHETLQEPIVVSVFGDSAQENCFSGGWGPSRSSEETTKLIAFYMEQDYGDRVRVEFHDISQAEIRQRYSDLLGTAEQHNLPYPLTAVNDVFRFAGGVSYYAVQKVVQDLIEPGEAVGKSEKE